MSGCPASIINMTLESWERRTRHHSRFSMNTMSPKYSGVVWKLSNLCLKKPQPLLIQHSYWGKTRMCDDTIDVSSTIHGSYRAEYILCSRTVLLGALKPITRVF
uniref:Uncharacterized protein n=1 Tax=Cacopsylla melanoneura TaxID=428564 RepID=A0A8D8TKM3_9HEMI